MSERKTYRFKNRKHHWAEGPHPEFWEGQKVARISGTSAYQHVIVELGMVVKLPESGSDQLTVLVIGGPRGGEEVIWGAASECRPVRWIAQDNRRTLRAVAERWKRTLADMDENGFPKPKENE